MDKRLWVVIYQDRTTGETFGWFCKEGTRAKAEHKFSQAISNYVIKTVDECGSTTMQNYLALYEGSLQ